MSVQRPLKGVIDLTDCFSRVPLAALVGACLLAATLVGWTGHSLWLGLGLGALALGDGLMLAALPRFEHSFGPPQLPWLSLLVLRVALALGTITWPVSWALPVGALVQVGLTLVSTYACWVEPMRLGVTRITVRSPRLAGCPPLRVLHISDLHVERLTARERRLLELAERLAPDVVVVTGDYLNISYTFDETAQRQTRELLGRLRAPGGIYAVTGSPSVDLPEVVGKVLDSPNVTWLRDQVIPLEWHGRRLQIAGLTCSYDILADERKLSRLLNGRAADAFTVLLYHTPDVMSAAAHAGVDLYLAGHTHGGQLRLPGFGALVTASIFWKRYEMGLYRQGGTTLYVSRGVGLEGAGAPRARFLCPPQVVLFTLTGADTAS